MVSLPSRGARSGRRDSRGQSLAEFAIVFPVFMLIFGAVIQGGILFWAQNTLTQVARDTGRWAATQQSPGCNVGAQQTNQATFVIAKAVQIASQSSLIGFNGTSFAGATVTWQGANGTTDPAPNPCPPTGNAGVAFVTITLTHNVPVFFPLLPGNISTSAQFRMEPVSGS